MAESRKHLGIYLRQGGATVVCLALQGRERKLLDCFSVSVEGQEQNWQALADGIGRACRERKVRFAEAAVALDCGLFMQHTVHSEFSDPKRIAATVRFDTEEALATDVSDVAVAFRVTSSGEDGSSLDVFTAQRAILSDILFSLQGNGIDPVTVDPDIGCLSRYLDAYTATEATAELSTLYSVLSDSRGYLVGLSGSHEVSTLRTFLIGADQDRNALLVRETLVTAGMAETTPPAGCQCVFDSTGQIAPASVSEKTRLPAGACNLLEIAGIETGDVADCSNAVEFALAYGAALALPGKANSINFRNDHMPYLGRKLRVQKAVRFFSISLTILLLAVGVFFHSQLLRVNRQRTALRAKFEPDYLTVMLGEKKLPSTMKDAVGKLERGLRLLKAEKTGIGASQESISAKLTLVLKALNDCARQTDLNVGSVTITGNSIIINGDTSSRQNTVGGVFAAIKSAGLKILQNSAKSEGGRDNFTVTVEPEKRLQGT
jgi:hypothetical protein